MHDFNEELFMTRFDVPDAEVRRRIIERSPQGLPPPRWTMLVAQPNGSVIQTENGPQAFAQPLWRGLGVDSYQTSTTLKPSASLPFRRDGNGQLIPRALTRFLGDGAPSLRLHTGNTRGISLSLGLNGSISTGESHSDLDFFDFNGDRLPDSVHGPASFEAAILGQGLPLDLPQGSVQIQNRAAERFGDLADIGMTFGSIRHNFDWTLETGFGLGSISGALVTKLRLSGAVGTALSALPTVSRTVNRSTQDLDFIDINGDGLLDHVRIFTDVEIAKVGTGMDVQLNLGHRLGRVTRY